MPSTALQAYQDHLVAIAAGDGGESAEWPDIAATLADTCYQELSTFPLPMPLAQAFAFKPAQYNGNWPILVVVHGQEVDDVGQSDSCYERTVHEVTLMVVCGPAGNDPGVMQTIGAKYFAPLKFVINAHQTLGNRCRYIRRDKAAGIRWQVLNNQWYGATMAIRIGVQSRRVWAS